MWYIVYRVIPTLIHHQEISENYVPAYDIIVTKYINLAISNNTQPLDISACLAFRDGYSSEFICS